MRIDKMITKGKNTVVIFQILPTTSVRKCMEISLENLYADMRVQRVNADTLKGQSQVSTLQRCLYYSQTSFYFLGNKQYYIYIISFYRSMDGVEEDEYTSDPIAQQTRQVRVFL